MADGFVHTVHRDASWRNTIEGEDDPLSGSYTTKEGPFKPAVRRRYFARRSTSFTTRTARSASATRTATTRATVRADHTTSVTP